MQNRTYNESITAKRERKLLQANFSDTQVTALIDLVAELVTKKEFHEFQKEVREGFIRVETRLDNMATKEEVADIRARLDHTATKEEFADLRTRLDNTATKEEVADLRTRLDNTATKEEVADLRARLDNTVTKEEFADLRARLDNTVTKEEFADLRARLDHTATKDDINQKHLQLLVFLPLITVAIVGVMLSFVPHLSKLNHLAVIRLGMCRTDQSPDEHRLFIAPGRRAALPQALPQH